MKERLLKEAFIAYEKAYAPYSQFHVGAALITNDNKIFQGVNVENASYGLTSCAERNALFNAYSAGYRKEDIVAIAIVTKAEKLTTPCGACRQVISELMLPTAKIYLSNEKETREHTIIELLPFSFSSEDL